MQSDVVITGYRLNAKEPAQKALERILGLTPDEARILARSFPAVVMQGAANDNAERIRAQLESAGALVEVRASDPHAPLELQPAPSGARGGAFDLDLDLPIAKGGGPAKANKGGTGTFGAPKTGGMAAPSRDPFTPAQTGASAAGAPSHAGAFAAAPKTGANAAPPSDFFPAPKTGSAALPPAGRARAPQPTSRTLRASLPQPPPPPAEAYQLGDFGVAPRGMSVVAKLPTEPTSPAAPPPRPPPAASPPTLADGDFDFDFAADGGLELDLGTGPRKSLPRKPSLPREQPRAEARAPAAREPAPEVHGERFGALAARGPAKVVDVDPVVMRGFQRKPASERPSQRARVTAWLREGPWLSLGVLVALVALTLAAVGYALDPADPIGGLARAKALPVSEPADEVEHQEGYLHPLLRNTPRALRAPVAAILRAQVSGVHDVPVGFMTAGEQASCTLVEHGPDTAARLKRVRETGHEVGETPAAAAQLLEHERALRAEAQRELRFTRVCLTP